MINGDEAVSLSQIALEIKSDDVKVNESSWKDEKIEKLVEQLKNQQNVSFCFEIFLFLYYLLDIQYRLSLHNANYSNFYF